MKKWTNLLKNDQRGLTLVELLAVVVILGIVGLIAFVAIGNVIENTKKDAHIANGQQVISAAELYEASGGKIGETLSTANLDVLGEITDPWNAAQDYTFKVSQDTNGVIRVTSTAASKCKYENKTKEELATEDRNVLCGE